MATRTSHASDRCECELYARAGLHCASGGSRRLRRCEYFKSDRGEPVSSGYQRAWFAPFHHQSDQRAECSSVADGPSACAEGGHATGSKILEAPGGADKNPCYSSRIKRRY